MRKSLAIAMAVLAALVCGCETNGGVFGNTPEPPRPPWVTEGCGELKTPQGKALVAVGLAWRKPDYVSRRQDAVSRARAELKVQVDAYMAALTADLSRRCEDELGAKRPDGVGVFEQASERVRQNQLEAVEVTEEWECFLRQEVFVRIVLPEDILLKAFREEIRNLASEQQTNVPGAETDALLRTVDEELRRVRARGPRGDLASRHRDLLDIWMGNHT